MTPRKRARRSRAPAITAESWKDGKTEEGSRVRLLMCLRDATYRDEDLEEELAEVSALGLGTPPRGPPDLLGGAESNGTLAECIEGGAVAGSGHGLL